jgi:hypothetical protein
MVKDCHKSIVEKDPSIHKALVKPDTLHVTLFAMRLQNNDHLSK